LNSGHSRFHRSRSVGCSEIETVTASRPNQEAEADGTALALLSPTITRRVIEKFARIAHPTPPKEFEELSERERDVFRLMARGLSNAEIGSELYIGETTVKTHVTHILQKLNLRDRVQAVVLAYQTGLFEPDLRLAE
jgi:DNA-binding NarL/FixJ family response regulator